ncbi:MAG: hypothetical protein AAFV88_01185 [Planctomycetota bacterium]
MVQTRKPTICPVKMRRDRFGATAAERRRLAAEYPVRHKPARSFSTENTRPTHCAAAPSVPDNQLETYMILFTLTAITLAIFAIGISCGMLAELWQTSQFQLENTSAWNLLNAFCGRT